MDIYFFTLVNNPILLYLLLEFFCLWPLEDPFSWLLCVCVCLHGPRQKYFIRQKLFAWIADSMNLNISEPKHNKYKLMN